MRRQYTPNHPHTQTHTEKLERERCHQVPEEMVWSSQISRHRLHVPAKGAWWPRYLPSLTTTYKMLQVAKVPTYICTRDPLVRAIASRATRREATQQRPTFKPFQEVISAMQEYPRASSKQLSKQGQEAGRGNRH